VTGANTTQRAMLVGAGAIVAAALGGRVGLVVGVLVGGVVGYGLAMLLLPDELMWASAAGSVGRVLG
jgi:hypothetical protein